MNRNSVALVVSLVVAGIFFGMFLNERVKMPAVKTAAEEAAREEMRVGVDADKETIGVKMALDCAGVGRKDAYEAGVRSATNLMPKDEFMLLLLEDAERDGTIGKETIALRREEAKKQKEERLKKAATP